MKITYANPKIEKFFTDYNKMQKKIPKDWVRLIKKRMEHLEAVASFGEFLKSQLGRPEQLTGYKQIRYSIRITANVRLIVEPNATQDTIMICTELEIEGVSDYHGDKENWYIS